MRFHLWMLLNQCRRILLSTTSWLLQFEDQNTSTIIRAEERQFLNHCPVKKDSIYLFLNIVSIQDPRMARVKKSTNLSPIIYRSVSVPNSFLPFGRRRSKQSHKFAISAGAEHPDVLIFLSYWPRERRKECKRPCNYEWKTSRMRGPNYSAQYVFIDER